MPCLAAHLYITVVSTRHQELDEARLVEVTAQELSPLLYVVSPCRHLYSMVVIAPRFRLSESLHDGRLAVYVKDNINLTTLSTNIQHYG